MKRSNLLLLDSSALIKVWLTQLRDVNTKPEQFRAVIGRITYPLVYAALSDLKVRSTRVSTPLEETIGYVFSEEIAVATILRAALGMVAPIQEILPEAKIFHVDMYRNEETLQPVWGRSKIPMDCKDFVWLIPDPMLATGGSAIATISHLKERGAKRIMYLGVIAALDGINALSDIHPDVRIVVAAVDKNLSDGQGKFPKGYIMPGLGDAGDRQFGT